MKEKIKGIIAIIVILAAVASLFFEVNEIGGELIRLLATGVVGYYFGNKNIVEAIIKQFKK